jgi:hypothetical protein
MYFDWRFRTGCGIDLAYEPMYEVTQKKEDGSPDMENVRENTFIALRLPFLEFVLIVD